MSHSRADLEDLLFRRGFVKDDKGNYVPKAVVATKLVIPNVVAPKVIEKKPKRGKYNVAPKAERTWKGKVYDSKTEMERAKELCVLESRNEIFHLKEQVAYEIKVNGILICKYIADFVYLNKKGETIVEDRKGVRTDVFKLKAKLLQATHGITIFESRAKVTKRKSKKK